MPQPATLPADRLRRPDRKTARTLEEVPTGYEGLEIVDHRRENDALYSPARALLYHLRKRLARIQRQPALITGFLEQTGLMFESQPP